MDVPAAVTHPLGWVNVHWAPPHREKRVVETKRFFVKVDIMSGRDEPELDRDQIFAIRNVLLLLLSLLERADMEG